MKLLFWDGLEGRFLSFTFCTSNRMRWMDSFEWIYCPERAQSLRADSVESSLTQSICLAANHTDSVRALQRRSLNLTEATEASSTSRFLSNFSLLSQTFQPVGTFSKGPLGVKTACPLKHPNGCIVFKVCDLFFHSQSKGFLAFTRYATKYYNGRLNFTFM